MITGFLFYSKLIEARTKPIDWERLFLSRVLRLAPLYALVMCALFVTVAYISRGQLEEPPLTILGEVFRWLSFSILGSPNLNGVADTNTIVAGVTWSLKYEWLFYFSLPLLAITARVIPPAMYVAFGVLSVSGSLIAGNPSSVHLASFLGGITAAFLVRIPSLRDKAEGKVASFAIIGTLVLLITTYSSAHSAVPVLLLSTVFAMIACGNNLFGFLETSFSRTLGEMAYSIYMVHGLLLFVTFTFVIGISKAKEFSPMMHWLVIVGATPVLLTVCYATFHFVERPAMQQTAVVASWFRTRSLAVLKRHTSSSAS